MLPPRVTIVIPVFNGANYLRAAIDSALAQDYPHLEVLVVNDGSCDDGATEAIARGYGDRIRYIAKPNGGVASALNLGIAAMAGEIFCWLSHDDIHLPHKTSRQVAEWERLGRPEALLFSDYRVIDAAGAHVCEVRFDQAMLAAKPLYAVLRGAVHGCSVFLPRRIFDAVGTFDEGLPTTQDYDLWHRMVRRFAFHHMPEMLIESRRHDAQGSRRMEHHAEAAALWIRLIGGVSEAECAALEGGRIRFLRRMADFLHENGLARPAAHAEALASALLDATPVTVVMPVCRNAVMAVAALEGALAQTHPAIEVLVIETGDAEDLSPLHAAVARHAPRARLLREAQPGLAAARARGWREAQGRYVAFLDADGLFCRDKIAAQLRFAEEGGFALSDTACLWAASPPGALRRTAAALGPGTAGPARPLLASTLLLRAALREEGAALEAALRGDNLPALWRQVAHRHATAGLDRALTVLRADGAMDIAVTAEAVTGGGGIPQASNEADACRMADDPPRLSGLGRLLSRLPGLRRYYAAMAALELERRQAWARISALEVGHRQELAVARQRALDAGQRAARLDEAQEGLIVLVAALECEKAVLQKMPRRASPRPDGRRGDG